MAIFNGPLPVPPSIPPASPPAGAPPPVVPLTDKDPDVQWALDLEQKVKNENYSPTEAEVSRYQDIAKALSAKNAVCPKEPESSKGLLDYPKDALMSVSEFAAAGTAKNTVEFLDDMHDIKEAAGDFAENVKHGEVLKAGHDVLRMGWNLLTGLGNAVEAGASSMLGGITMVPTVALNLLDEGSEAAGKKLLQSDSGIVRGVGQGLTYLGGENSNKSYLHSIREASLEAEIKAKNAEH